MRAADHHLWMSNAKPITSLVIELLIDDGKLSDDDTMISNSRMWDAVWPDGDIWKSGLMAKGLYVSPDRDLVIAYFSVNEPDATIHRYLRPLATSGLFDSSS